MIKHKISSFSHNTHWVSWT